MNELHADRNTVVRSASRGCERRPDRRPVPDRGRSVALTLGLLVTLAACAPEPPDEPYVVVADVPELMAHVMEPNAQHFWRAVGWVLDGEGEHELRPETDEEWLAVENAAFVVAESGNLLMMQERALDDDAWMQMSRALVEIGQRAVEVAENRDEQGVFDVGAEMYYVCTQCHARYAVETLRPSDDRAVDPEDSQGSQGSQSSGDPGDAP